MSAPLTCASRPLRKKSLASTHQSTNDGNLEQNNCNKKYDFRQPNRCNGDAA